MDLKDLQKKHNLHDLEICRKNTSSQKLSFVANKLKQTESTFTNGVAVRLINNKKIGFASGCFKDDPMDNKNFNLEDMVALAKELSSYSQSIDIEFPNSIEVSEVKDNSSNEDFLSRFKENGAVVLDAILSNTKSSSLLTDISFEILETDIKLENSRGLNYSNLNKILSFFCTIRETQENDFIEIYTGGINDHLPECKIHVDKILKFYKLSKKHKKIKNGNWPVLFTSKALKELLNIVEIALSGKYVNEKSSPWTGKIRNRVLSKLITIKQDSGFGYMARSCDDEGVPIQSMSLIEDGILKNFYYDLLSSRRGLINQTPTGNGFRPSLSSQPEPVLLNMIVSKGEKSLDEIIKNIKYGLLVDQTIGGLSTNISGDMSVNIDLGFLIEKGELIGRVKDTMISGNVYNALNNVLELSNHPQWHWSNIFTPDVLVDGFTVTSK